MKTAVSSTGYFVSDMERHQKNFVGERIGGIHVVFVGEMNNLYGNIPTFKYIDLFDELESVQKILQY